MMVVKKAIRQARFVRMDFSEGADFFEPPCKKDKLIS